MINHLWQSTLFGLAAAVAAFTVRKRNAQARYWIWVIASAKFLVPLTLFAMIGSELHFAHDAAPTAQPVTQAIAKVSEPFPDTISFGASAPTKPSARAAWWLTGIWACGVLAIAWTKLRGWREVRAALQASTKLTLPQLPTLPANVDIRTSSGLLEPSIIGWFKPVLMLPSGIAEQLQPAELQAVITHELAHVKRRDNLVSALHMLVETIFWFHPLVWWIGARMLEERERACDETVLRSGAAPADYAEGILKVCRIYVESPFRTAAGVTGADLKRRVRDILRGQFAPDLNAAQKSALAVTAMCLLAAPVWVAMTRAASVQAQSAVQQKFEVASIRPCTGGPFGTGRGGGDSKGKLKEAKGGAPIQSPDKFTMCATLSNFIRLAYFPPGAPMYPDWLQGGPAWISSDAYMINAKASQAVGFQTLRGPMLRALLAERFHLQIHSENRETLGFALTVNRGGIKAPKIAEGSCIPLDVKNPPADPPPVDRICGLVPDGPLNRSSGMHVYLRGDTLPDFAQFLSAMTSKPVVDRTGLSGRYDFRLDFVPDEDTTPSVQSPPGAAANGPSLFTALQEFGLRLESAKAPREYFVIDHVERPTEN
jgi:uncharacterized protein (TIGR03435 family)